MTRNELAWIAYLAITVLCAFLAANALKNPPLEPAFTKTITSAYWYFDHAKFNAASNAFFKARSLKPHDPLVLLLQKLRDLVQASEPDIVVEEGDRLLAEGTRPGSIAMVVGDAEVRRGNIESAKAYFERALAEGANPSAAWYRMGLLYARTKNYESAVEAYQQALHLEKRVDAIRLRYALSLLQSGRPGSAVEILSVLSEQEPYDLELMLQRAVALLAARGESEEYSRIVRGVLSGLQDMIIGNRKINGKRWRIWFDGSWVDLRNKREKIDFICGLREVGTSRECRQR